MDELSTRLEELRDLGLYRRLRLVSGPQGAHVVLDGKPVLLLCSNNYLGLSDHPRIREAAADAAMRWGVGAGASRLVSGSMTIHRRLEERLAALKGTESAVLFGSGYLANVGVIQALGSAASLICSDELNHASIIEGCRAAKAPTFVYRHGDLEHLAWGLRERVPAGASGRPLIVTDSIFSMDGDTAPLQGIVELAREHGARTVVDEAHATGAWDRAAEGPSPRRAWRARSMRSWARWARRSAPTGRLWLAPRSSCDSSSTRRGPDLLHGPRTTGRRRSPGGARDA